MKLQKNADSWSVKIGCPSTYRQKELDHQRKVVFVQKRQFFLCCLTNMGLVVSKSQEANNDDIYSPHLRLFKKLFVLQWNFNIYLICKHSTIKESPPNHTSQLLYQYLPPPPTGEISKLFMGLKSWVELTPPRPWQLGRWCGRLDSTQLFRAQKSHLWCLPLTHSLPDYLSALLILPSAWFPRTIAGKSIETCQVLIPC